MHWGGYAEKPFMPYRSMYLDFRLPGAPPAQRRRYQARAIARMARDATPRGVANTLRRRWAVFARNWLASRGYVGWP